MNTLIIKPIERRSCCYVQPPSAYEVASCDCGNADTQWSEFVGHLWCETCKKDFIPSHNGIFDGPIPIKLALMMGLSFDRVDLATKKRQKFNSDSGEYEDAEI